VHPSVEVLSALADALQLDPAERRHPFILNNRPPPEAALTGPNASRRRCGACQPDMKLIVYTPLDEDKTAIKLQGLLRTPSSRNQTHAALAQPMSVS